MNKIIIYQKIKRSYIVVVFILFSGLVLNQVQAGNPSNTPVVKEGANALNQEVWGYDLGNHERLPKGYKRSALVYHAPNGDTVFKIRRCIENCDKLGEEKYEYAMLWFFAGKIDFTQNTEEYSQEHQLKSNYKDVADLLNGECVKPIHVQGGTMCQANDLAENLLIKGKCDLLNDKKLDQYNVIVNVNPEIKCYSVIGAQSGIYRYIDKEDGYCDRGGPRGGEVIYQQLYPMQSIIGLEDGTFTVSRGDLIIRFDSDFKTKFKPKRDIELAYNKIIKGNFFVLPYEKIQELDDKVAANKDHGVQGLHDELLLYLYRREENK